MIKLISELILAVFLLLWIGSTLLTTDTAKRVDRMCKPITVAGDAFEWAVAPWSDMQTSNVIDAAESLNQKCRYFVWKQFFGDSHLEAPIPEIRAEEREADVVGGRKVEMVAPGYESLAGTEKKSSEATEGSQSASLPVLSGTTVPAQQPQNNEGQKKSGQPSLPAMPFKSGPAWAPEDVRPSSAKPVVLLPPPPKRVEASDIDSSKLKE